MERDARNGITDLTDLQYSVLRCLLKAEASRRQLSGHELREELARVEGGSKRTRAAFYQLMERLESEGLATSEKFTEEIGDQMTRGKYYRITGAGQQAVNKKSDYYESLALSRELRGLPGLA